MITPATGLDGVTVFVGLALCLFVVYVRRRLNSPGVSSFATFTVLLGLAGVSSGLLSSAVPSERWPKVETLFWGVATVP